ncbi:MAG: aminotransferase class V-fold PLP-dependent enzyme [Bacteroidota bacterium]
MLLREHFPHTAQTVYLNHAATGPLSRPVMDAVAAYLAERHGDHIENFLRFQPTIEATRAQLAQLLGTQPGRVEFAPNTSYALNVLALGLDWQPGDRIALPDCEFPTNVYPFLNLRRLGVDVDFIPTHEGAFTVEDVERTLTDRTRLVSVSWVQFLSGFRADLAGIGQLCKERDVLFCVDAIQGMGALQLGSVHDLGIDFLACGCHKWLMSTQGLGFLFLTQELQDRLTPVLAGWLHGPIDWEKLSEYDLHFHPDATRFRLGTTNNTGIAALNASLKLYLGAGASACERQVLHLAGRLRTGLLDAGLAIYGATETERTAGIVTVRHPEPEAALERLNAAGVEAALRNRLLRLAPTYYNTESEVDVAIEALGSLRARGG